MTKLTRGLCLSNWGRLLSRATWALIAITVFGGVLRMAVLETVHPADLVGDEVYYVHVASNIAQGKGHLWRDNFRAQRAPVHPFVLSLAVGDVPTNGRNVPPDTLKRLLYIQTALGTLLVLLTGILGCRLFDTRVGIISAFVAAIYPTLIAFSHYLWAQPLFSVLVLAALILALGLQSGGSLSRAALCGLVFGAAGLTREIVLPVAVMVAIWLICFAPEAERKKAVLRSAVMLLFAALVVIPWTIRNYLLLDRFVPVSTLGHVGFYEGTNFKDQDWVRIDRRHLSPFRKGYRAIDDEVGRMDFAKREARALLDDNWAQLAYKKTVRTFTLLLTPDSFIFKKVTRRAYDPLSLNHFRIVLVVTILTYLIVASMGVLGVAAAGRNGRRVFACLILLTVGAIHFLTTSWSRYRVSWIPLLIPYAVYAMCSWRELRERAGWRIWPACVVVLLLLGWCLPFFWPDAVLLWREGRYVDLRQ